MQATREGKREKGKGKMPDDEYEIYSYFNF